ncbi:exodeoxyribonuclease VII large subunit [Dermacoccus sp. 147Ba]|uniref:exodeoxyribonuclease VII large subunit n=1 Tax=Dermacoccus sp. 147Ba TaxID=2510111 RepID=UPI00101BA3CF|nr:exodeoxyribonuclease VII large subunit [Dermacoccus sp. 147Ba]RYI23295.1 exodeoxyribonuclease VII large subunit [Dermacoccus sp. 147Ba]
MTNVPPHLPQLAGDTSAESPWPVRVLSMKIAEYVDRMSPLWVEGQIVQLNVRARTAYLTLRDADVDMSLSLTVPTNTLNAMGPLVREGARVVVHAKQTFWTKRGQLMLEGRVMRPVGEGELLLRLEQLKRTLAAEGIFDRDRKKALPFLPRRIGLVTGRAGAAENDVVENARRRWPAARFEIRQVAVQGPDTVQQVGGAIRELDEIDDVDVIVVARGGGSFEDLLPFSNEALVRVVAAARTPIVSAIGHDVDTPLLDHVADLRASTPTDAGKSIVPDLALESSSLREARVRLSQGLRGRFAAERRHLNALVSRPALADPSSLVADRRDDLDRMTNRSAYALRQRLSRAHDQVAHARAQVVALSPQRTLDRGYAVVQQVDGTLVTSRESVSANDLLKVTVADGNFAATPVSATPTRDSKAPTPKKKTNAARKTRGDDA